VYTYTHISITYYQTTYLIHLTQLIYKEHSEVVVGEIVGYVSSFLTKPLQYGNDILQSYMTQQSRAQTIHLVVVVVVVVVDLTEFTFCECDVVDVESFVVSCDQ